MAEAIRMPLLSDTMTEGVIAEWHKKVGDKVKSDDVLADVETDKATMEVMPYADGTLLYIGVKEGEAAKVNDIIAIVGKEGEDVQAYLDAPADGGTEEKAPAKEEKAAEVQPAAKQEATEQQNGDERLKASPLAKKLAEEKGIDVSRIQGSGDNGRIIKRDIDNYKPEAQQPAQAAKEQQSTTENHKEQQRTSENHKEQQRTTKNNKEQQRTTQNHKEPQRTT